MQQRAIIIGSGFGGLAMALRARALGYAVTVLEKNDQFGGRARVFHHDGYTFDAGPTVITAPYLFDELFTLFGRDRQDYVDFIPLDLWYRFIFSDGSQLDYGADLEQLLTAINHRSPRDVKGYHELLAHSRAIFDVGFTELADQPFHQLSRLAAQVPRLLKLKSYQSVATCVAQFIHDPQLRRAFSIHPLLVGGNPYQTTSIYTLIHYLERRWGVHYVKGGTGALVAALVKLAQDNGVVFETHSEVTALQHQGGRITRVLTQDGREFTSDIVISNMDPAWVYTTLLPGFKTCLKARYYQYSMGLYVLYFGTNKRYAEVAHHSILFGDTFKGLLDNIYRRHQLDFDLSLYLHRPTATDPTLAPPGHECFYVLAPVPNLKGNIDWAKQGAQLRDHIIDTLERRLLPGLRAHVTTSFYMTPQSFCEDYHSLHGAGFSISPLFRQSAWFRFHNADPNFANLYHVGAGTHPGAGLPGVVSSAKVVAQLLTHSQGLRGTPRPSNL